MTGALIWIVPVGRPQFQQDTELVLARRAIPHAVTRLSTQSNEVIGVSGAIIQGGEVGTEVLDALRWLTARQITTLVLAEHLRDHEEAHLLGCGAQDVVDIPTSAQRLDSRIAALLRRLSGGDRPTSNGALMTRGALSIDLDRHLVSLGGAPVTLTKTEFELLATLTREPRRVFSHEHLMSEGSSRPLGLRALETHLSRTRMKLLSAGGIRLIEAVRGQGYRLGHIPATVARDDTRQTGR